jgi:chemotaxis protein methyltransferase CheR
MIYFNQEMNRHIVARFRQCLTESGWLIVGHAESNVELFQAFETVNNSEVVLYRKTASAPPASVVAIAGRRFQRSPVLAMADSAGVTPDHRNEATDVCREQTTLRPLNPDGHFRYALLLQQRGRLLEAEQSLRRAIYLDRGFVLAHYYLGLLLKRRSELPGARRCFRNALRLLEPIDERAVFADAEGIDASALTELTRKHFDEVKDL